MASPPPACPVAAEPQDQAERYAAALRQLQGLQRFGVRLGLERMVQACAALGHPERRFAALHLAGTNGKGSTAAMLAACLAQSGLRVGLYTSPHLCRFCERIQVDGQEISPAAVARLTARVLAAAPQLTFFEAATAMAFCYFAEQQVQVAVLETGLGGRLDATNVIQPQVCVLSRIDLDHQELLGPSRAAVAGEKAGIIKAGVPVVSAPLHPEARRPVEDRCRQLAAPLLLCGRDFSLTSDGQGRLRFCCAELELADLQLALAGAHQQENAALCLAALAQLAQRSGLALPFQRWGPALGSVRWPGRMEWLDDHLLDGAHNPAATTALVAALEEGRRFCLVAGLLGSRQPAAVLGPLLPRVGRVILTRPPGPRALAPEAVACQLAALAPGLPLCCAPDLRTALQAAASWPGPKLISGSLYLVGEARALLLGEPLDPVVAVDPLPGPGPGPSSSPSPSSLPHP